MIIIVIKLEKIENRIYIYKKKIIILLSLSFIETYSDVDCLWKIYIDL